MSETLGKNTAASPEVTYMEPQNKTRDERIADG